MKAYRGRTVVVDGVSYVVHLQGGRKHVRVYRNAPSGIRKVTDLRIVRAVVQQIENENDREQKRRARAAAAAAATPDAPAS